MKTMSEYVEALKAAHNIPSDRQLAKFLGLSKQAVSHWKERGITVDPDTAWRIAEGIGADPLEVIAASEIERAKRTQNSDRARLWSQRLRDLSAALCVVSIGVFGIVAALPANAATALQCILCQIAKADPRRPWWHSATIANRSIFQRSKTFCLQ